jgi:hypothetical protein
MENDIVEYVRELTSGDPKKTEEYAAWLERLHYTEEAKLVRDVGLEPTT